MTYAELFSHRIIPVVIGMHLISACLHMILLCAVTIARESWYKKGICSECKMTPVCQARIGGIICIECMRMKI